MNLKRDKNKRKIFSISAFFFLVFIFAYNNASAATLRIDSTSAILAPGNITTLSVVLNSEGLAINNADAKIVFPADLLEVVSISKGSSIFTLWVEEPAYSNITGVITWNGGIPTPGFTGPYGTAISVVVRAKKAGQANIIFSDASVRANDGLGTDVLTSKTGKTISIISEEPTIKPIPESTAPVAALQITSPTHPSQEQWYKDTSPIFRWKVPAGVGQIQTGIDNHASGSPRVTFSPAISERTVKDLDDGSWYFKVRARQDGEWGPISTYIARIDTTIPQLNEVAFSYDDDKKVLNIKADIIDMTSGIEYYELYVNEALVEKISSAKLINGSYDVVYRTPGDNVIRFVAVDRAGNSVEATGSFFATAMPEMVLQPDSSRREPLLISIGSFTVPALYLIILLLSIIILLILGAYKLGRHYSKFYNKLKLRTALGKGNNTKVLILLKKRLEKHLEILQHTRRTRILSKEEKEIKEAIEGDLDEVDRAIEEQKVELDK